MRERIRIFFLLAVFWLAYMVVARGMFMAYNADFTAALTWQERFLSMLHGLRMDASITGYFLAFSGLLLTLSAISNSLWLSGTLTWCTMLFLILCSVMVTVDLELYRHWGFRLNTTPLLYIGSEAMGSVHPWILTKLVLIFLALTATFSYVFYRKIYPFIRYMSETRSKSAVSLLFLSAVMFLPIRGSFTVAPMNTGFVFYHNTKPYANHTAVNVVWNFLYNVRKSTSTAEYPVNFVDRDKAEALFKTLYPKNDSTHRVFASPKPNILLIILESFTADVVEPLGGLPGVTPNLNMLCREGILFDNFYSSGDRTDKGLISILSGYPAQPRTSIIKLPAKTQRLPQLNQYLKNFGYKTSFIYGGDIDFANFRSYLATSGFDHLTELDDFDKRLYTSKWGVHDHYLFEKAIAELDTISDPFFKVILTLSSHEPFDVPTKSVFDGTDEEAMFLNSCHYTDQALAAFITYCKTRPWWSNTVVVITADHGHRNPGNKALHEKERFRVPLLLIGGAIRGDSVIHTIGNQTDIANTILGQLDKASPRFIFSKDLFGNNTQSFAAYFFNDGFGFITRESYVVHDNQGRKWLINEGAGEHELELGKAYQQTLYTDYNNIDKR
jgi:phosphoglycerol transferase MdoB-like AlkP superfamily enzyme